MNCSICGRITGTGKDHADCLEKRRIEMEDESFKLDIPERMDLTKNPDDLSVEMRAILGHMKKENAG